LVRVSPSPAERSRAIATDLEALITPKAAGFERPRGETAEGENRHWRRRGVPAWKIFLSGRIARKGVLGKRIQAANRNRVFCDLLFRPPAVPGSFGVRPSMVRFQSS